MDRKFPIVFTLIWGGALFDEKWKCEIWNMKTSNWGLERRAWAFAWEHPHIRLPSLLPLFRVSFEYRSLSFRIQITQSKNKKESFVDQARIYDKYWPISGTSAEGGRFSGGGGHAPLENFLVFWVIQTGYWPNPFSSDKALQIGGLFHLSSSTWKVFFYIIKYIYHVNFDRFP